MVKARATRAQRKLPSSIVLILACGHDFFHDLPGGVAANWDMLEAAWDDPSIRERVYRRQREKHPDAKPPFAEFAFGKLD